MQPQRETLLCRYHYDPLDRLADCTPTAQASTQRFYVEKRLATEIQGTTQRSIMQHEDQLLAQQQRQNGTSKSRLLTTDQQRSVLAILDTTRPQHLAYTPYGHRGPESGLLGFNGERPDPVTGHYLLGNGYRAFNPVLMRFNSPDSWSPFGRGGLNAYGYCVGDPINRVDPNGHFSLSNLLKYMDHMLARSPNTIHPTQRLSQNTINSLKNTLKNLGGREKLQHLAKDSNMTPEDYLLNELPELKSLSPAQNPDTLDVTFVDARRAALIEREIVLTDLRALESSKNNHHLLNRIDTLLEHTQKIIEKNRILSNKMLAGLPPYHEVINSSNSHLPSYATAVRKK
jgi:RHS repeat-associated protein